MSDSDSDSDVEEQNRRLYQVSQVLQPLAPDDNDYNEWPCFLLEDATVVDKHGNFTSLLDVATSGPLTVEGRLHFEPEDELLSSLKSKSLKDAFIRVEEVKQFSFGSREHSADTGHVCLWGGSTKYGWFEISPAQTYERAYVKSVEAVNIYYFVQSLYKQKGSATLSIGDVLYRYATLEGSGRNRHDVETTMKRHARFLLTQMNMKEEVNFPRTTFYNWVAKTSPDVVAELKKQNVQVTISQQAIGSTSVPIPSAPIIEEQQNEPEPYERPEGESDEDTRGNSVPGFDDSGDLMDEDLQEFNVPEPAHSNIPGYIAWYLEWARHYGHPKYVTAFQKLGAFTARKASTIIYTELRVSKYNTAGELLRLHRLAIAEEIAKYPIWLTTPMYEELKGLRPMTCERRPPEFVTAAKEMTTISRRNAMVVPRRTKNEKQNKTKTPKIQRSQSNSPSGNASSTHHFAPRFDPSSRSDSPALPISSKRLNNMKPLVVLPAFTGSKEDIKRREAALNLAKTSGEGVSPPPRGKTPLRKPINLALSRGPINSSPSRSLKRSRTEEEQSPEENLRSTMQSPPSLLSSDDDSDEDESEPVRLTVVSVPQHTIDEAGYGLAENVLAKETVLTGHDAPFLKQLIAEGKERLKDRETIGGKVVPRPIRGLLRDPW